MIDADVCGRYTRHLRWLVVGRANGSYASGSLGATRLANCNELLRADKGVISQVDRSYAESWRNLRYRVFFPSLVASSPIDRESAGNKEKLPRNFVIFRWTENRIN